MARVLLIWSGGTVEILIGPSKTCTSGNDFIIEKTKTLCEADLKALVDFSIAPTIRESAIRIFLKTCATDKKRFTPVRSCQIPGSCLRGYRNESDLHLIGRISFNPADTGARHRRPFSHSLDAGNPCFG